MSTAQSKVEQQLRQHLESRDRDVAWHHRLGTLLLELKTAHPTPKFVPTWAGTLGIHKAHLFKAIKLAELFTGADLVQVQRIEWSHASYLLTVPEAAMRRKLLDRAIDEEWSVPKMRSEIARLVGVRPPRGGRPARPLETSSTPNDLRKLEQAANQFKQCVHDLFPPKRQRTLAKTDPELKAVLNQAEEARRCLDTMTQTLSQWWSKQS